MKGGFSTEVVISTGLTVHFDSSISWARCICHIKKLCVEGIFLNFLDSFFELIERVRTIIQNVLNSAVLTQELSELIDIANLTTFNKKLTYRLVKYVPTRWLTNYDMLSPFLQLKDLINQIISDNTKIFSSLQLSLMEIYIVTGIGVFGFWNLESLNSMLNVKIKVNQMVPRTHL